MTFQVQREEKNHQQHKYKQELFPLLMFHCLVLITDSNQGELRRVLRRYRELIV